jgi:hypothetical protein
MQERIVDAWIFGELPVPQHLRKLVQRYRDLDYFSRRAPREKEGAIISLQNNIYDQLLRAATAHCHVPVEKQLRRLQRRDFSRMSFQEKCNLAIEMYHKGIPCPF